MRLGWEFPLAVTTSASVTQHGAIMASGFLASLILLEKIVLLHKSWFLLFPFINVLSVPLFLLDFHIVGIICLLIGSTAMVGIAIYFILKYKESYHYLLLGGAVLLWMGNFKLLLNSFYPTTIPFLMGFFLLVIVGERLEMSRFLPVSKFKINILWALIMIWVAGVLFISFHSQFFAFASVLLSLIALWLLQNDMPKHSIKKAGLHRFVGINLIIAYLWLFIFGIWQFLPLKIAFAYDAYLHLFFIGFVLSMVLAHAPVILPSVLKLGVKPFYSGLYVWVSAMQISLIIRIIGDVNGNLAWRKIGGVLNGVGFIGYLAMVAILMILGGRK
ncbi:MAG: hypothetical protein OHK0057_09500 [Thermoflexibacter sp.]